MLQLLPGMHWGVGDGDWEIWEGTVEQPAIISFDRFLDNECSYVYNNMPTRTDADIVAEGLKH